MKLTAPAKKTIELPEYSLPEWATLEYDNGIKSFDPSSLVLHLEKEQETSFVVGSTLRERLSNKDSANFAVLSYLKAHPQLIPSDWKGRFVYGWGTIVRDRDGDLVVPFLCEDDGQVVVGWYWLVVVWYGASPAARFASTSRSKTEYSPMKKTTQGKKVRVKKTVEGFGVFVRAYGGLIGFSTSVEMANKLAKTEYAEVSMSRSESEFKIKPVKITYHH
jgi:hypothetical protein